VSDIHAAVEDRNDGPRRANLEVPGIRRVDVRVGLAARGGVVARPGREWVRLTGVAKAPLVPETRVVGDGLLGPQQPVRLGGEHQGARREASHCLRYTEPGSELDYVDPEPWNAPLHGCSGGRDHPLGLRARNAATKLDQHTTLRPLRRPHARQRPRRLTRTRAGSRGALRHGKGQGCNRCGCGHRRGDHRASHNRASAALSHRGGFPITRGGTKVLRPHLGWRRRKA